MAHTSVVTHHHRSTTKTIHKPFKPRFSSKGALKDQTKGKTEERRQERGKRRTPHQQIMSKIARRNQARQQRIHHHETKETEGKIFQGLNGAPKHVAMIPLSLSANTRSAILQLNESVDVNAEAPDGGAVRVRIDRFRRNLLYIPSTRDLLDTLSICRLADWVVLLLSLEQGIDKRIELFLRSIEGQGVTNVIAVVQNVEESIDSRKRAKAVAELKESLKRFFPDLDRVYSLDSKSDCSNLVRTFCTASSRGIKWRDRRSWMLVESLKKGPMDEALQSSDVILTGTVRGQSLNLDRLVHVPGWGDCQIGNVAEFPDTSHKRKPETVDAMEDILKAHLPGADQDDLEILAPEEDMITEDTGTVAKSEHKGVLLDDHHYFSDDNNVVPPPTRIPKGTSAYQAAWYLDDVSDSGSDLIDDEDVGLDVEMTMDDMLVEDQAVSRGLANGDAMTDAGPSEYPEPEMHVDKNPEQEADELIRFRESRRKEAKDDREFPDEIELHPNALARERLAKYRGLKSPRTSEWNIEADIAHEPKEYQRLLKIENYKKSCRQAIREALADGVAPGTRVDVTLTKVPLTVQSHNPTSMFSLLRHEHKHTVVNLNLTLYSHVKDPVKSKEELIVQIGPRCFIISPLFSAPGITPNNVHKFNRYLHPSDSAIATFIGPLTWGSNPVLVFKRVNDPSSTDPASDDSPPLSSKLSLIGTATTLPLSHTPTHPRIIAKRAILTGHPYKIHKRLVTVRYMFFNKEDIAWFSALPLWTKRGRQGTIKESLGTHGYFKATFDAKVNPMDAVAVSLYKRVWPRPARAFEGDG